MKYKLWNRIDKINGVAPIHFLNKPMFKNYTGDIILIYDDNDRVIEVENKETLAKIYGIDVNLPLDTFMSRYAVVLDIMTNQE